jgi:predicted nucleic acid-binding Zn ribbon protein
MGNYNYFCKNHGEIVLNLKMSEIQEEMPCPLCKSKMERIYSPISDFWKCSGSYRQTRRNDG